MNGPGAAPAGGFSGPPLPGSPSASEARTLIEGQGLRFEPDFDDLTGLFEDGQLVACGARRGYVLKMLAIAPPWQGTDALGGLVTQLLLSALAAGEDTVFVFTPPRNAPTFQAFNFRLLATTARVALLEHGPGLPAYLATHPALPGSNGAVVINGNPFTLGHLHLVETAARQVDHLYLFVVREELSLFPFAVRFRLAREACAHLGNVTVLDTSRYAVSAGTFPSYFLKTLDAAAPAQMEVDLQLFATRIAPPFHIAARFVGQEPSCPLTAAYNLKMAEILQAHTIRCVEVPRVHALGSPISATRVRRAFADRDLHTLEQLVPPTTHAYLRTQMEET